MGCAARNIQIQEKGGKETRKKILSEQWEIKIKSDTLGYADGVANKSNGSHEIYPKITTVGKYGKEYRIDINWGKIKIICREKHHIVYDMKKTPWGIQTN